MKRRAFYFSAVVLVAWLASLTGTPDTAPPAAALAAAQEPPAKADTPAPAAEPPAKGDAPAKGETPAAEPPAGEETPPKKTPAPETTPPAETPPKATETPPAKSPETTPPPADVETSKAAPPKTEADKAAPSTTAEAKEGKAEEFGAAPAEEAKTPTWLILLLVVVAIALPIGLAVKIATEFRLRDFTWKIWLVLFCTTTALIILPTKWPPGLGIDLKGGAILVYQVDMTKHKGQTVDLEKLIGSISKRLNPGGVSEIVIRPYGQNQIEIIIPNADDEAARRMQDKITRIGSLEFRILATMRKHRDVIELAKRDNPDTYVRDEAGEVLGKWVPIAKDAKGKFVMTISEEEFTAPFGSTDNWYRRNARGEPEILVVMDHHNVTGDYLASANQTQDSRGLPAVGFNFNTEGAYLFSQLTGENLPITTSGQPYKFQLAILLDDHLQTSPNLNSRISDNGIIEGQFTTEEVRDLVAVLNAGSLPATLEKQPLSAMIVGPTLGEDTIRKGSWAIGISLLAVLVFIVWYYRFSGVVACVVLMLNLIYVLALMMTINAVFTLPGIAGMVLTVGMAVDANVLIYERIREELNRGAALRMAIRNGFDRATTTIVDANLTTLITATVLYWIGTDQVRGFAVTLWLGVVLSMFTAIFVARLIFDIVDQKRWKTSLPMMQMLTNTNLNFLSYARPAMMGSLALIGVGMLCVVARGKNVLDIDFTGGVSVQLLFSDDLAKQDKLPSIEEVRTRVRDGFNGVPGLPDGIAKNVSIEGEDPRIRYQIDTSLHQVPKELEGKVDPKTWSAVDYVEERLGKLFPGMLAHNEVAKITPQPLASTGADAAPADSAVAPRQFAVQFKQKIDHDTLRDKLLKAFQTQLNRDGTSSITLKTSGYVEGSREQFESWNVILVGTTADAQKVTAGLGDVLLNSPFFPSSSTIGGAVAANTQVQALTAILVSLAGIVAYLWFRFHKVIFGLAAVAAVVHDVLVTLGMLAASYYLATYLPFMQFLLIDPFKINLTIVAAFLTIIGYSLNDTIVIFDRIREVRGKSPDLTADQVNLSINQTLSRTILTTMTTLIVVVVLYIGGGDGLRAFSFALIVGLCAGTYSTVFIASPVLLWLHDSSRNAMKRDSQKESKVPASSTR